MDTANPPRLLNQPQLAKCLGISVTLVRKLTANEEIPYIIINRRPRYEFEPVLSQLRETAGHNYDGQSTDPLT